MWVSMGLYTFKGNKQSTSFGIVKLVAYLISAPRAAFGWAERTHVYVGEGGINNKIHAKCVPIKWIRANEQTMLSCSPSRDPFVESLIRYIFEVISFAIAVLSIP